MSTDEYVPSYTEARAYYVNARAPQVDTSASPAVEFDRFLARVRRDAAREALDGLAEHINWTASQFLGIRVGAQKAQDVRDYRDEHYPDGDAS